MTLQLSPLKMHADRLASSSSTFHPAYGTFPPLPSRLITTLHNRPSSDTSSTPSRSSSPATLSAASDEISPDEYLFPSSDPSILVTATATLFARNGRVRLAFRGRIFKLSNLEGPRLGMGSRVEFEIQGVPVEARIQALWYRQARHHVIYHAIIQEGLESVLLLVPKLPPPRLRLFTKLYHYLCCK